MFTHYLDNIGLIALKVNADCDVYCFGIVTFTVLKTLNWIGGKEAGK
jgi:hypothetical protein